MFRRRIDGLAYPANDAHPKGRGVSPASSAIAFGGGQNRIYILNTEANESKECFLSAQTDQARHVWRTTFINPLLTERFRKAWTGSFNGPLTNGGLAGYWTVAESEDQKHVVVTWAGSGSSARIRLRFDVASGKLLAEDFSPEELGEESAGSAEMDRGKSTGAEPRRR